MKNRFLQIAAVCFLGVLIFGPGSVSAQVDDRFFDSTEIDQEKIILPIFYSHPGSWQALLGLDNILDVIDFKRMTVVYIYHEKEIFDCRKAMQYVTDKKIEWLKFHEIRTPLDRKSLFQNKALHDEFDKIFKRSDGVIFFGGYDIPAYVYEEKTSLLSDIIYPYRHFIEISAVFYLLGGSQDKDFNGFLESKPGFPILGICLGCQTLNVGTGGSMIQDIWADVYRKMFFEDVMEIPRENLHRNPLAALHPEDRYPLYTLHPIKLQADGKFCKEMGFGREDRPLVLSGHHQALGKMGKGLRVIASSLDGKIVEAIEHEKYPNVLGIQFHPDAAFLWDPEAQIQFFPGEKRGSLVSRLKAKAPSYEFNRKIWSWFDEKLKSFHSQN
ncbi:MAG: gamma-glutamyl-gamma-aminobutyrate hydrolase family protein [Candidatus Aminicenantes bacterium]|nr:gamma-glutamyl-gamma-aminobutyrate hydrolase family protein [Candidatus Aminicenantes bacterium]